MSLGRKEDGYAVFPPPKVNGLNIKIKKIRPERSKASANVVEYTIV